IDLDRDAFLRYYYAFVYVRIMQALGAYGYRGFFERKVHFLQSVPYALKNIRWLLHNAELPIELPTLLGAFQSMLASEKLQSIASEATISLSASSVFRFTTNCPRTKPVMAAASPSMAAAYRTRAGKNASNRSLAATRRSSTISISRKACTNSSPACSLSSTRPSRIISSAASRI